MPGHFKLVRPGCSMVANGNIVGPGDMVRPEVPASLDLSLLPALCSCSDQGPSNTASLNFLMFAGEGLMVQVQYDHFHRGWNDVKLSAKRSAGYPWRCMLQMVLLFNINYSPFGSSGFFYKKQSVLENFFLSRTFRDPSFQAAIPHICKERRIREPESIAEQEELFKGLAHMSNFIKKGSLIKLMRWISFFEVACEWRGDLWATKLILESDNDTGGHDDGAAPAELPKPLQEPQTGQEKETGKLDAKKELADLKKANGVWRLAPRMITTKNLATLDYLILVAKATWQLHAEKSKKFG